MKAVRFDRYGGVDVLEVREVPVPVPGAGEVRVEVKAAGINPGEAMIRQGAFHEIFAAKFPSGQGSDLAGVVTEVGPGVELFSVGDEVLGFTNNRASHAEFVVVPADQLTTKPPAVSWEAAGALFVAGTTAYAAVGSVELAPSDNCRDRWRRWRGRRDSRRKLAKRTGATVLGVAGPSNDQWLAAHGVIPVNYGDGLADRLRTAAPDGRVDAFLDFFGGGYVELAITQLGIDPTASTPSSTSRR